MSPARRACFGTVRLSASCAPRAPSPLSLGRGSAPCAPLGSTPRASAPGSPQTAAEEAAGAYTTVRGDSSGFLHKRICSGEFFTFSYFSIIFAARATDEPAAPAVYFTTTAGSMKNLTGKQLENSSESGSETL